ncbi:MAG TPA: VOC family protein [Casimicrobiaceae bacterium]|nr:VOC family protein [Casimicrobiaceae bacterium]
MRPPKRLVSGNRSRDTGATSVAMIRGMHAMFYSSQAERLRAFFRDDIVQTMRELSSLGVEFTQEVEDHGYGLVTFFKAPGDFTIQLYQPKYAK